MNKVIKWLKINWFNILLFVFFPIGIFMFLFLRYKFLNQDLVEDYFEKNIAEKEEDIKKENENIDKEIDVFKLDNKVKEDEIKKLDNEIKNIDKEIDVFKLDNNKINKNNEKIQKENEDINIKIEENYKKLEELYKKEMDIKNKIDKEKKELKNYENY